VASAQITKSVHPQKKKRENPNLKEESACPEKKKKVTAIISMYEGEGLTKTSTLKLI
jgi:hypothetical protein